MEVYQISNVLFMHGASTVSEKSPHLSGGSNAKP